MKRLCAAGIILGFVSLLCGCETVGAFGTRRITTADVAYIAHAGSLGKTTAPVNVNSKEPDTGFESPFESTTPQMPQPSKVSKADDWVEENLW